MINKGNVIKEGISPELDNLESCHAPKNILKILERETKGRNTSLKISFNNVFGYYLEVRNIHKDKVNDWIGNKHY